MPNREEILKALKIIKSVCEQHDTCAKCPFSKKDSCILQYQAPTDWNIADQEIVWKAFN